MASSAFVLVSNGAVKNRVEGSTGSSSSKLKHAPLEIPSDKVGKEFNVTIRGPHITAIPIVPLIDSEWPDDMLDEPNYPRPGSVAWQQYGRQNKGKMMYPVIVMGRKSAEENDLWSFRRAGDVLVYYPDKKLFGWTRPGRLFSWFSPMTPSWAARKNIQRDLAIVVEFLKTGALPEDARRMYRRHRPVKKETVLDEKEDEDDSPVMTRVTRSRALSSSSTTTTTTTTTTTFTASSNPAGAVIPNEHLVKNPLVSQRRLSSLGPEYVSKPQPSLDGQPEVLKKLPALDEWISYEPEKMSWDDWHYNNTENKLCYCGHGRTDWAVMPMLICVVCANSFHQACFKEPIPDEEMPMEVSWGHEFVCANCNVDVNGRRLGVEKLDLWFPGWSAFTSMAIAVVYLEAHRLGDVAEPMWVTLGWATSGGANRGLNVEAVANHYLDRYQGFRKDKWFISLKASAYSQKQGYLVHGSEVVAKVLNGGVLNDEGVRGNFGSYGRYWSIRRLVEDSWPGDVIPLHVVDPVFPRPSSKVKTGRGLTLDELLARKSSGKKASSSVKRASLDRTSNADEGARITNNKRQRTVGSQGQFTHSMGNETDDDDDDDDGVFRPLRESWKPQSAFLTTWDHAIKKEKSVPSLDMDLGLKLFQRVHLTPGFDEDAILMMWDELSEVQKERYRAKAQDLEG